MQRGRKRKRHEVFDPATDKMDVDAEEAKKADRDRSDKEEFKDVTTELKRPQRNRGQGNRD